MDIEGDRGRSRDVPLLTVRRPSGPRARRLRDIIEYPHSVVTSRGYAALKGRRERQRPAKTARPAVSSILSAVRGHGWLNGCSARKGAGPQRPLAPCVANPHRGTKLVRAVLALLSLLLCVPRARVEPRRAACTMRCTQSQCAQVRSTISFGGYIAINPIIGEHQHNSFKRQRD